MITEICIHHGNEKGDHCRKGFCSGKTFTSEVNYCPMMRADCMNRTQNNVFLKIENVSKSFNSVTALHHISLNLIPGLIYGFLGPNGAGKTTLIRIILDILRADSGTISTADELSNTKAGIGYLPEERGLYQDTKVIETLMYFGRLKGLTGKQAKLRARGYLHRFGMQDSEKVKINSLSKGNQQKIQLIAAIFSLPPLLILDEPFTGLDPLNINLVLEIITELKAKGITIVLSTHRMNQVEQICDHIFLFNKGHLILDGNTEKLISEASGTFYVLRTNDTIGDMQFFTILEDGKDRKKIALDSRYTIRDLFRWAGSSNISVHAIAPYRMSLSEIFIRKVNGHDE